MPQALGLYELLLGFLQVNRDGCSAGFLHGFPNREFTGAIGCPGPCLRLAGLSARHLNTISDDEG